MAFSSSSRKAVFFPLGKGLVSNVARVALFSLRHRRLAWTLSWLYRLVLWMGLAVAGVELGTRIPATEPTLSNFGSIVDIGRIQMRR